MKINDRMVQWLKNLKLLQIDYKNLSNMSSCNFWSECECVCVQLKHHCLFFSLFILWLFQWLFFSLKSEIGVIFNVVFFVWLFLMYVLLKVFYATYLFKEQSYKLHSPTPHAPIPHFANKKKNKEACFALKLFWINTQKQV